MPDVSFSEVRANIAFLIQSYPDFAAQSLAKIDSYDIFPKYHEYYLPVKLQTLIAAGYPDDIMANLKKFNDVYKKAISEPTGHYSKYATYSRAIYYELMESF
jgi:hypothetical protein